MLAALRPLRRREPPPEALVALAAIVRAHGPRVTALARAAQCTTGTMRWWLYRFRVRLRDDLEAAKEAAADRRAARERERLAAAKAKVAIERAQRAEQRRAAFAAAEARVAELRAAMSRVAGWDAVRVRRWYEAMAGAERDVRRLKRWA